MKKLREINPDAQPDIGKLRAAIDEMDRLAAAGQLTQAEYDRLYDEAFPHAHGNGQLLVPLLKRNPRGVRWIARKRGTDES